MLNREFITGGHVRRRPKRCIPMPHATARCARWTARPQAHRTKLPRRRRAFSRPSKHGQGFSFPILSGSRRAVTDQHASRARNLQFQRQILSRA